MDKLIPTPTPLLESLFKMVAEQEASDLHLRAGRYPTIRVNRDLISLIHTQTIDKDQIDLIIKGLLGEDKLFDIYDGKEIDFSYSLPNVLRVRGTAYLSTEMPALAFRVISKIKTIEELGLPQEIAQFARARQGMFLVAGASGQGKSTTLAAIIDLINHERKLHIVTVEDPIEYVFESVNSFIDQRQVGKDTLSFLDGLTSSFRQDADVIMIGEMRDQETMEVAVTAAETGHLVYSTLHTSSASLSIDRIINSFPAERKPQVRNQLASNVIGVFSQRLIKSRSGKLVPIYELMIMNEAVKNLIREGRVFEIDSVIDTHKSSGMISNNQTLLSLVRAGEITVEDALSYSTNQRVLRDLL